MLLWWPKMNIRHIFLLTSSRLSTSTNILLTIESFYGENKKNLFNYCLNNLFTTWKPHSLLFASFVYIVFKNQHKASNNWMLVSKKWMLCNMTTSKQSWTSHLCWKRFISCFLIFLNNIFWIWISSTWKQKCF